MYANVTIKVHATKGLFLNSQAFRKSVVEGIRDKAIPLMVSSLEGQVEGWKKRPGFQTVLETTSDGIVAGVVPTGPTAKVWWWHIHGVEGRVITPKTYYRTAGGKWKHKRGLKKWRAALKFTGRDGTTVFRYSTHWRGIKPRRYDLIALNRITPTLLNIVQEAVRNGTKAAQREGK